MSVQTYVLGNVLCQLQSFSVCRGQTVKVVLQTKLEHLICFVALYFFLCCSLHIYD